MLLAVFLSLQSASPVLADLRTSLRASPQSITATLSRSQTLSWASYFAEGTVIVDFNAGTFRVDATVREARSETERTVTLFFDGNEYIYLDHTDRAFSTGPGPLLGGVDSRVAWDMARVLPTEPGSLADSGTATLAESLSLAGTLCHTILAKTSDGPTAHLWYVGERDSLPRLWETTRELGAGDTLRKRLTIRTIEPGAAPALTKDEYAEYEQREALEWVDPESLERHADSGSFTTLEDGASALREQFNAAKDRVRAIGLFAPS